MVGVMGSSYVEAIERKLHLASWMLTDEARVIFSKHGSDIVQNYLGKTNGGGMALFQGQGFFHACTVGDTYYCSRQITSVIEGASQTLEDWTVTQDLIPTPTGFVWFDKPIHMPFPSADEKMREQGRQAGAEPDMYGFVWATFYDGDTAPEAGESLRTHYYRWSLREMPPIAKYVVPRLSIQALLRIGNAFNGDVLPLQSYSFVMGETLQGWRADIRDKDDAPGAFWNPFDESFARILGAFLLFINQDLLTTDSIEAPRATRKRAEALSLQLPTAPTIDTSTKVVMLRKRAYRPHESAAEREAPEWSCQWMVRGHWRQQYYPSRGINQPKWIAPYVKGPEDKPLKPPRATVFAVVR